jgi:hypothetical protein
MTHSIVDVTNGPAKDDLLRAVTSDDGLITTIFDTSAGALEAQIVRIEERGDLNAARELALALSNEAGHRSAYYWLAVVPFYGTFLSAITANDAP